MDNVNDVADAVQLIFEVVTREFTAALPAMPAGRWVGLTADARARLSLDSHAQVQRLSRILDGMQASIDSVEAAEALPAELDAAIAAAHADAARRTELNARLRALLAELHAHAAHDTAAADAAATSAATRAAAAAPAAGAADAMLVDAEAPA